MTIDGALESEGRPDSLGQLVVMLSPERSGSTLTSVLLGAHPRVVAPPELHLLRYADFDAWRSEYPAAVASLVHAYEALGVPLDEGELAARFGGRPVGAIYEDLLARCGPSQMLVDKTPAYVRSPAALERAERFRPAYLWLVRHPLGVANSRILLAESRRRSRRGLLATARYPIFLLRRWSGRELRYELDHWVAAHEAIETFLAEVEPSRWHRVHYEALVRSPKETLERVCRWLGLDLDPAMLDFRAHLPESLRRGIGDEKIRQHTSIDPALADQWRTRLSESSLDGRTRAAMRRLGVVEAGGSA